MRPYVHNLYEHLACCDLALVQGGLSTTMELVATRRPFLSFPLQRHFEQCVHVRQRLANYGADRSMDYAATLDPDVLARARAGRDARAGALPAGGNRRRRARRAAHCAGAGQPLVGAMRATRASTAPPRAAANRPPRTPPGSEVP